MSKSTNLSPIQPKGIPPENSGTPAPIKKIEPSSLADTRNQTKDPVPSSVKPTEPVITFEIKKRPIPSNLHEQFGVPEPEDEYFPPSGLGDFFSQLNITSRIEVDTGLRHTIDVQSDFRYPFCHFLANTVKTYPSSDVKPYPFVSPMSIVAYKQILFYASYLLSDLYCRPVSSCKANEYRNTTNKKDYLNLILRCPVPYDVADLIIHLAPVIEPCRELEGIVPSLACAAFPYDFETLPPPYLCLFAHNALATIDSNTPISQILRNYYNRQFLTVNEQNYLISNYFGNYYLNIAMQLNRTWISQKFETLFSPLVSRAITLRPSLFPIDLFPYFYANNQFNIYDYTLGYSDNNYTSMCNFLHGSISVVNKYF